MTKKKMKLKGIKRINKNVIKTIGLKVYFLVILRKAKYYALF